MTAPRPSPDLIKLAEELTEAAAREGFCGVVASSYGGISLHSGAPLSVGVLGPSGESSNAYIEVRPESRDAVRVQVFGVASDEHPDLIARRAARVEKT